MNSTLIIILTVFFIISLITVDIMLRIKMMKKYLQKENPGKWVPAEEYKEEKKNFASKAEFVQVRKEFDAIQNFLFLHDGLHLDGIVNGNEEIGNGNFTLAEIYFKQELYRNPHQANLWVGMAHAYSGLERYYEALNSIKTAISLDQANPFFNKLGQISVIEAEILMKLNRYVEAAALLKDHVLILNPNFLKARKLLEECNENIRSQM